MDALRLILGHSEGTNSLHTQAQFYLSYEERARGVDKLVFGVGENPRASPEMKPYCVWTPLLLLLVG